MLCFCIWLVVMWWCWNTAHCMHVCQPFLLAFCSFCLHTCAWHVTSLHGETECMSSLVQSLSNAQAFVVNYQNWKKPCLSSDRSRLAAHPPNLWRFDPTKLFYLLFLHFSLTDWSVYIIKQSDLLNKHSSFISPIWNVTASEFRQHQHPRTN